MTEAHDLKKEQVLYYKVFGTLGALTVVTVAISNLKVGIAMGIILALLVAITKASLVASFFMHLSHEKKLIYIVLSLTAFLLVYMMGWIVFGNYSVPQGAYHTNFEYHKETQSGHGQHDDNKKHADGPGDHH